MINGYAARIIRSSIKCLNPTQVKSKEGICFIVVFALFGITGVFYRVLESNENYISFWIFNGFNEKSLI